MDQRAHQSNILEAQGHGKTRSNPPGSFLAKGGGQWWDPLVGWPYLSADWWAQPPTSNFGQRVPGSFLKSITHSLFK